MPESTQDGVDLEREAAVLAGYLLGRQDPRVPDPVTDRYARACRRLFTDPPPPSESAVLRFACRHPSALPCLDAASGLLLSGSLLRQKLILMLAILETVPELAERFLPAPRPRALVLAGLARTGAAAALKTLGGVLLLPLARWTR